MKKIYKIIPKYSMLPLLLMLLLNGITYFGTRPLTEGMVHHSLQISLDVVIPFIPLFSIVYILAYAQWIAGYIIIVRESRECCKWIVTAEIIAKTLCLICFVIYPTTIVRPEIASTDFFSRLTAAVYQLDAPDNLFPSIHCLESWFCFRGSLYIKKMPGWYSVIMLVSTILVFMSTVCLKQHFVLDIAGAVLVAEFGLWLSAKTFRKEAVATKKNSILS